MGIWDFHSTIGSHILAHHQLDLDRYSQLDEAGCGDMPSLCLCIRVDGHGLEKLSIPQVVESLHDAPVGPAGKEQ